MDEQILPKLRVNNFETSVLRIAEDKQIGYIDAVLEYCRENGIDPDYVKNLMTDTIRELLAAEYQALNMLPKCAKTGAR